MRMNTESLFSSLREILVKQFDVDESAITMDANLYEELEIDSIDAVDLLVELKNLTGKKIAPETFKEVRTIRDVLDAIAAL